MCGLFGFVSGDNSRPVRTRVLAEIAAGVEPRGPHAWGVAWVDINGRMRMYKQPGRITEYINTLVELTAEAVMVIGHCRWATHGHPSDNATNHPHPADGGWLTHNGQIEFAEDYRTELELMPVTECDSELIGLAAAEGDEPHWHRLARAVDWAQHYGHKKRAHAVAWLLPRPATLILCRASKPLVAGEHAGGIYYTTTGAGLQRPTDVPDGSVLVLRHIKGKLKSNMHKAAVPTVNDGNLVY